MFHNAKRTGSKYLNENSDIPCFFLSCKANARVKLAKTGHGPHSSTLACICVVQLLFVLFCVLFVCKCVLPPGDNPISVNKYIISYHIISYHIISYHIDIRKKYLLQTRSIRIKLSNSTGFTQIMYIYHNEMFKMKVV